MLLSLPYVFFVQPPNKISRVGSFFSTLPPRWGRTLDLLPGLSMDDRTPEAWWFDGMRKAPRNLHKVSQGHSSSASTSLIQWRYVSYISKLLANFPVTYRLCPTTQGGDPTVSTCSTILVVQDTSLLRASWTWRVQGIGVVAEPRPDRFRQEGGWKVGAKSQKL